MAYCALADATALIPKFTVDASSKPTTTQATQFVADAATLIDARLAAAGFVTPVVAAISVALLKVINAYGAAWKILEAMFQAGEKAAEGTRDELKAVFDGWLARIETNPYLLSDATRLAAAAIVHGPGISSLRSWQLDKPSAVDTVEAEINNSPVFRVRRDL